MFHRVEAKKIFHTELYPMPLTEYGLIYNRYATGVDGEKSAPVIGGLVAVRELTVPGSKPVGVEASTVDNNNL